jgi:hypothetical protein
VPQGIGVVSFSGVALGVLAGFFGFALSENSAYQNHEKVCSNGSLPACVRTLKQNQWKTKINQKI